MCFSASASFGASIVLTVIGVATLKKVRSPKQIIFASIPLIFALQHFSEGFLWLALQNPAYAPLQQVTTYMFIFLAQIIWPIWVPLGIVLLEKKEDRKMIQKVVVMVGILLSAILGFCLASYSVTAEIQGHHVRYFQDYPKSFRLFGAVLYIIATIFPLFISRIKGMLLLGATILISYIITAVFYQHYILSVWCFFASIISLSILRIMYKLKSRDLEPAAIVDVRNPIMMVVK